MAHPNRKPEAKSGFFARLAQRLIAARTETARRVAATGLDIH